MGWQVDGYHPLWSCIRLALLLGLLFAVLYTTASNFDETELKAIGMVALGMGAGEMLIPWFRQKNKDG